MTDERATLGVVILVHGDYGEPLVRAAEAIVGPLEVAWVQARPETTATELRQQIDRALAAQDRGKGVLVLTDLCGSTPANLCLGFFPERPGIEILTGVNLAMLMKLSTCDRTLTTREAAEELQGSARRSIQIGTDLLAKGEPRGH